MNISIIAIPQLLPDDFDYLQSLRARHDPDAGELDVPHLTVVSPTDVAAIPALLEHVRTMAGSISAFAFTLRCAMPVRDADSGRTSIWLVPDRGFSSVVRMHDLLYGGPLRDALTLERPFIPHLRIAAFDDPLRAQRLAGCLNREGVSLMGTVGSLQVVERAHGRLEPVARIALAPAPGVPETRAH